MITSVIWILFLYCTYSYEFVLFHARKASGTDTLRWLNAFKNQLQTVYNRSDDCINIVHVEGYPFIHYDQYNAIDHYKQKFKNGLFVMTFRDPVERILSQYEFEWRWLCQGCDRFNDLKYSENSQDEKQLNESNYLQRNPKEIGKGWQYKYKYSNIEMELFLDRVEKYELNNTNYGHKYWHWHKNDFGPYLCYLNNYYLWLFCCDDEFCKVMNDTNITQCFEHAKQMIDTFDVILITPWLNDKRTNVYVNKIVHNYIKTNVVKNLSVDLNITMIPDRWENLHGVDYMQMVSNKEYQRLIEWNKWDIKLYEYVKQKSYERIQTIWSEYGSQLVT
eukprot:306448_1